MKQFLIIVITIFCCSSLFGQNQKDSVVLNYIKAKNQYVAFSDTANLPPSIQPHYKLIMEYFSKYEIDANDYFVMESSIRDKDDVLAFSLFHYDGFVKQEDGQEFIGNASGKDGDLKIDTKNKTVISFLGYK